MILNVFASTCLICTRWISVQLWLPSPLFLLFSYTFLDIFLTFIVPLILSLITVTENLMAIHIMAIHIMAIAIYLNWCNINITERLMSAIG